MKLYILLKSGVPKPDRPYRFRRLCKVTAPKDFGDGKADGGVESLAILSVADLFLNTVKTIISFRGVRTKLPTA